jgi:serine protease Do
MMKKYILSAAALAVLNLAFVSTTVAQDAEKKKEKFKTISDYEEIIIRKKGDGDAKVTVEIIDGKVKVDGKSLDAFESDDISVLTRKPAQIVYGRPASPFRTGTVTVNGRAMNSNANRAFLGVATQESADGVKIEEVTDGSAAEKSGLKEGDIILKIDDAKISEPSDVTQAIRKHKPEDKVTITYKRSGKENKATATLGKSEELTVTGYGNMAPPPPPLQGLNSLENMYFDSPDFNLNLDGRNVFLRGRPRVGIRAQDTEDDKGAKVLDVSNESAAAKAGIQKDDIITSYDGKNVKNADDLAEASQEAREKNTIDVKLERAGKSQTVQIKIPKKLKTTTL